MFLENFVKFIRYFGKARKLKLTIFALFSLIAGGLEFLGIALIYPFILMIIRPESMTNLQIYQKFASITHLQTPVYNALVIGAIALVIFVLKNVYMVGFMRLQSRFLVKWRQDIANTFMKYFIYASYKDIIKCSNSDKYYVINNLCYTVLSSFVMRIMTLFTNAIIVLMVVSLILLKFPIAGILTIIFSVTSMLIQNKFLKHASSYINSKIQTESKMQNFLTCSNIDNIKEIKINGTEDIFYNKYTAQSRVVAMLNADSEFYSGIPPYIVEILIVVSLLIMGSFIAFLNIDDRSAMVASFALVVASLFRIAPALNRIQTSIINIGIGRGYIKALIAYYESFGINRFKPVMNKPVVPMSFEHKIEIKDICFSYTEGKEVLKNISFEIQKGDFIGIIGLSGSGKTTLADIIMGLLPADSGQISVDGIKLTEKNYRNFRSIVGYVPQEVRIIEGTFKQNIAWGAENDEINEEAVKQAIRTARLDDFVNLFDEGIEASPFIGEHGASQGQKQRIALARALYKNPEILILDEATSSLDVKVEHEITDMLTNLNEKKTIIAIAHRLSTLKTCNKIVYMKEGKLVDIGTFEELSSKYEDFNALLKLSTIN